MTDPRPSPKSPPIFGDGPFSSPGAVDQAFRNILAGGMPCRYCGADVTRCGCWGGTVPALVRGVLIGLAIIATVELSVFARGGKEEEKRVATAEVALPSAGEPALLNPICPDQWIAQRSAGERWVVKCLPVSTEGSRIIER